MKQTHFELNWNKATQTATVNGLQMIPDAKVEGRDGYTFTLRHSDKAGWHLAAFKGDLFIPRHIPMDVDGPWTFAVVKDQRPASDRNPSGLWLSAFNPNRETNPIKRVLRDRGINLGTRQFEKVAGDQPMDVEVSNVSDVRKLPRGLRALSFICDGTGIETESEIGNLDGFDSRRGKVIGATFCIQYSTEVRNGRLVPWITKVQIREDVRALRTTAFEQALTKLQAINEKRPELFLTNGSAEPEPGYRTSMADALSGLQIQ